MVYRFTYQRYGDFDFQVRDYRRVMMISTQEINLTMIKQLTCHFDKTMRDELSLMDSCYIISVNEISTDDDF